MTSKNPKERFKQHKEGTHNNKGFDLSSAIVKKYGIFLRPSLYFKLAQFKKIDDALAAEKQLAAVFNIASKISNFIKSKVFAHGMVTVA